MRIIWHSAAPWANTGYGRCTREVVPRLQKRGYDIAIQCLSSLRESPMMWHGEEADIELESPIKIYPVSSKFGINDAREHYDDFDADFYFTHFDSWMEPARDRIPEMGVPYGSWTIVDHYPAPDAVVNQVRNAKATVAMSKYAKSILEERGIRPFHIPHGVSTDDYHPLDDSLKPAYIETKTSDGDTRQINLKDNFLFGMVAANHGDRKHIPGHMEAFKMFLEGVDEDAIIYIHTNPKAAAGHDLINIQEHIGIPDKNIIWAHESDYQNVGDTVMNRWYNAFDVFLNCSYGESWGLTITEAMATETPCVVSSFSSMPEQVGAREWRRGDLNMVSPPLGDGASMRDYNGVKRTTHGLMVDPNEAVWREKVAAKQYICNPAHIFSAMLYYYENKDIREKHGELAREYVKENYKWDTVIDEFDNLFSNLVI